MTSIRLLDIPFQVHFVGRWNSVIYICIHSGFFFSMSFKSVGFESAGLGNARWSVSPKRFELGVGCDFLFRVKMRENHTVIHA